MISAGSKKRFVEKRGVGRTRISKRATIVLENSMVGCMLLDITARGACLQVAADDVGRLPRAFALSLDNCQSFRQCRVVWRRNELLGVLF